MNSFSGVKSWISRCPWLSDRLVPLTSNSQQEKDSGPLDHYPVICPLLHVWQLILSTILVELKHLSQLAHCDWLYSACKWNMNHLTLYSIWWSLHSNHITIDQWCICVIPKLPLHCTIHCYWPLTHSQAEIWPPIKITTQHTWWRHKQMHWITGISFLGRFALSSGTTGSYPT